MESPEEAHGTQELMCKEDHVNTTWGSAAGRKESSVKAPEDRVPALVDCGGRPLRTVIEERKGAESGMKK